MPCNISNFRLQWHLWSVTLFLQKTGCVKYNDLEPLELLKPLILECVIYILGTFFNNLRIKWHRFEIEQSWLKENFNFPYLVYFQG